jgi:hypothetical protein
MKKLLTGVLASALVMTAAVADAKTLKFQNS